VLNGVGIEGKFPKKGGKRANCPPLKWGGNTRGYFRLRLQDNGVLSTQDFFGNHAYFWGGTHKGALLGAHTVCGVSGYRYRQGCSPV